jgi:uncharacterized protein YjbJ (UPF0337 family)
MNWDRIEGNWKQLLGHVGDQRQRDQLIGKIQECYGCAKDEAELQVKAWEQRH